MSLLQKFCIAFIFIFFAVLGGPAHFWHAEFFVSIVPPYLPWHLELVYISGVFEIIGGIGLLHPSTRKLASVGLMLLIIAVFPANIHMAMHPDLYSDLFQSEFWQNHHSFLLQVVRPPLQLGILAMTWFAGQTHNK